MSADIDSYNQLTIRLKSEGIESLSEYGEFTDFVYRTPPGTLLPLVIRVKETGWRAEGLPKESPFEEKKRYEVDIPPEGLERIIKAEIIGTEYPTVDLRKVYIGSEFAF